ncbi:hypothetical protein PG991_014363 [Apiospora marii]|uniref:PNPLA domain-containing protein n=1 Tax=Apiospora marii TaxID=335849 RepID=A0ABR1R8N9_9PEZI
MSEGLPSSWKPCQTCGTTAEKTYTCIQCNNLAFCDPCWPRWVLHVPGAVGWDGKPHEKADPMVIHRLRQILEPVRTEEEHEAELLEDEDTTWLGFGRDANGRSVLHDYGRFAAIMGETTAEDTTERFPQLVSFIGETGAGKSTLIKLLIDRQDLTSLDGPRYYSPVTSSNHDRLPTTGDVHLYADPSTLYSNTPALLVDCEGLSGGEAMPKQLRHRSLDGVAHGLDESQQQKKLSTPRTLAWAKTPQTRKREFAVSQLYPRILYTFSDVVVFVLRNPRAFESTVLGKLLQWGAASIDKSLNQPVLPHAVIVLNATDASVDAREWDIDSATQLLMSDIRGAIDREPALQEHVRTWRARGKAIRHTQDLLECYYTSVSVVRVPYKGSYMLMHEQAGKLSALIKDREVRMLASTERLQFYLQAACDHFARDLDTPFDFIRETLRHSPVSRNFEGNILNLALLIKEQSRNVAVRNRAEAIFRAMAPMIASCVMFDTVRQNLLGSASQLLDDRYAKPCAAALEQFANMYWSCSYANPGYGGDLGHCCNVRSGHNPKGHQNRQGKIIGNGDYESELDVATFGPIWTQLIRASLKQLQAALFRLGEELADRTELQTAALLHRERLNELYSNVLGNATDFVSYSACLCCLRELPECVLPCGHILCLPCIQVYGHRTSRTTIEISRCPLHVRDVIATPPWVIATKPPQAGARILCLDGGGIRGVVQLQILREVERILGPDLPIQVFFDLIVGTNFGGLIAIGLGVKKWTTAAALDKFKDLCREAFAPRELNNVPLFGALTSLYHGSLYKTQPFAKALQRYFADQPFFGGASHRSVYCNTSTKVAVTATTVPDKQLVLFANYNRLDPQGQKTPYQFIRSDAPAKEIKIWEAARATAATSPFFKPFRKDETGNEYADAGYKHACPVWVAHHEARSIWRDPLSQQSAPDILLSLGTGRHLGEQQHDDGSSATGGGGGQSSRSMTDTSLSSPTPGSAIVKQGRGGAGNYKRQNPSRTLSSDLSAQASAESGYIVRNPNAPLLVTFNNPQAGAQRLTNTASRGDRTWHKFLRSSSSHQAVVEERDRHRYVRICPEFLGKLPKFDEVARMDELERETERMLRQNPGEVTEVAHRLVASSFFFEKEAGSVKQTAYGFQCSGSIHCSFRMGSLELKALGWFLISFLVDDFEPYFLIEEHPPPPPAGGAGSRDSGSTSTSTPGTIQPEHRPQHTHQQRISLTNQVLQDIHQHGTFELGPLQIDAASEQAEISISLRLLPCNSPAPHSSDPYYGKRARRVSYASSGPGGPRAGHRGRNNVFLPISGFPRRLMAEDGIAPLPTHSTVERQKKPPMSSGSGSGSASGSMSRTTTTSSSGGSGGGGGGGGGEGRRESDGGEPTSPPPPQVPPRNATRLSVGSILTMTSPLASPVSSHSTGHSTGMTGLDTLHEVKHRHLSELPGDFPMVELSGEDVGRSDSGES